MKPLVLEAPSIRSVTAYLEVLFLRFPGTLGPEEPVDLELFDTYDRAWTASGQIWAGKDGSVSLLNPPCLFPESTQVSAFGLQKPVKVGRAVIKRRTVQFTGPYAGVRAEVLKTRSGTYMVFNDPSSSSLVPLAAALSADGWTKPARTSADTLVRDPAPFEGPRTWPAPDPSSPGAPFLLERMKDEWRLARQYEKGIRLDIDTECLHQYRVHLRRVRSLAASGLLWDRVPEAFRLKAVLRDLQQQTGELRDLDVLLLDLPGYQARLPWDEGTHLAEWSARLGQRRAAELRRVRAWMGSDAHRHSTTEVERLFEDLGPLGDPMSAGDLASSAFQRAARGLRKSLKAATQTSRDEALHEVRIRAKKLRYALDGFEGLLAPPAAKVVTTILKGAQEGLGRFQDRAVLLGRLQAELNSLRQGRRGPDPLAFGLLVGILVSDHAQQKKDAMKDCGRLGSKALWRALESLGEGGAPREQGN